MRERRCIATGEVRPEEKLIRFVVGPEGDVVPDIAAKLPGRGLWVTADAAVLARAVAKNAFAKAAQASVRAAPGLVALVERLLVQHMQSDLGLARRAGLLVLGFDNVLRGLGEKVAPRALVEASEGAEDGRRKLASAAAARGLRIETIDCLSSTELSLALGRENVIHAAVKPGPLAERLIFDSARLVGFRMRPAGTSGSSPARNERDV
ncbi:MAG: RNA-binding protein [Alphaproteobacteria bacterium]|nr:RNA-binding protein [Alphaproteobacteria bacterium]MDE2109698.1 RNA-binding protein [Alphaproteobacteria bacterium]MDE2492399.1 RNA-binding protein [Alphaproteobacteria bacterium]